MCLTIPDTMHSGAKYSLPPWLDPQRYPVLPEDATSYSRVLELLCSPTVSSVSSGRRHGKAGFEALTDETKTARSYAGQYIPGVITQFCLCQLTGHMLSDVRKAVLRGIFACIDVVERDVLEAMNSGMDTGMRAVWKGLYADWKRSKGRSNRSSLRLTSG